MLYEIQINEEQVLKCKKFATEMEKNAEEILKMNFKVKKLNLVYLNILNN